MQAVRAPTAAIRNTYGLRNELGTIIASTSLGGPRRTNRSVSASITSVEFGFLSIFGMICAPHAAPAQLCATRTQLLSVPSPAAARPLANHNLT